MASKEITIPSGFGGYPCIHCGKCEARLQFIKHDVCAEVEPDVTFTFVCRACYLMSYVDLSDCGTFLGIVEYQVSAYK